MKEKLKQLISILRKKGLVVEAQEVNNMVTDDMNELHIYDFDNTLFRAPSEPAFWEKGAWWTSIHSLVPPCVPEEPDSSWWIEDIVSSARKSFAAKNVYSVLLTGRQENVYGSRIRKLLNDKEISFDLILLSDSLDAMEFKSGVIRNLLKENNNFKSVTIWDDRALYLDHYKEVVNSINPNLYVNKHLVTELGKGSLCEDPPTDKTLPSKTSYVGLFIDSASKGKVIGEFAPLYSKISNHCIHFIDKPSSDELKELEEKGIFGKEFSINVTGTIVKDGVQILTVDVDGLTFPKGTSPCLILSYMKKPSKEEVKNLLRLKKKNCDGPKLKGTFWWKY